MTTLEIPNPVRFFTNESPALACADLLTSNRFGRFVRGCVWTRSVVWRATRFRPAFLAAILVLTLFSLNAPLVFAGDHSESSGSATSPPSDDSTFASYVAGIASAQASLRLGHIAAARRSLKAAPKQHRGWEWRHLIAQLDESRERYDIGGGPVLAIAVSPDGRTVAAGGADGVVRLWSTVSGTGRAVLTGHTDAIDDVRFSADGKTLITASRDGTGRVWDLATNETVHVSKRPDVPGSWDGTGSGSDAAGDAERPGSRSVPLESQPPGAVTSISVSPGGSLVACILADRTVRVWNLATRQWVATVRDHEGPVHAVAFSPNGKILATAADDGVVRLWDVSDWSLRARLRGHRAAVHGVAWSPRGNRLYSGGADGSVWVWDSTYVGYEAAIQMKHSDACHAVFFGASGNRLFTCGASGWVNMWDAKSGRCLAFWEAHAGASCDTIDLARDGRRFASCSSDETVRVWDLATNRQVSQFEFEGGAIDVAMSPDSSTVAIAHGDIVTLDDLASRAVVRRFAGHEAGVTDVTYSADGSMLASASFDGTARVWHAASGLALATMRGHKGAVNAMAFDRTGSLLATGGADGSVKLWSSRTGAFMRTLYTGDEPVVRLVFSPDAKRVAVAARQLVLVDVEHGVAVASFKLYEGAVSDLQFSADGQRLVSCSRDSTIVILDARSFRARMGLPIRVEKEDE